LPPSSTAPTWCLLRVAHFNIWRTRKMADCQEGQRIKAELFSYSALRRKRVDGLASLLELTKAADARPTGLSVLQPRGTVP
jgi:hypothetical protein